ncbi:UDP-glucose 4-epimerase [Singulisphaera sp. GP187]|uniref:NAD-dependent epimerase/dehydratase family protein n=1 Tax=Singulisphaera sp. GP187 TaxID=1882752 RepID=UPI000928E7C6|nr:NAD-dependent epimerase/dehydratase family protein [Singulisphaera sp. GP187]SIO61540.1 UDP-glucose 4-epimerase [Singulisphaera sp. GP187]
MTCSLEGKTFLVTGGAGLIGSHIVDQLIDEGAGEIRVLDNLVRGSDANLAFARSRYPITFIDGDVRNRRTVADAVAGCDYVFHQAAIRITLCAEQPRECLDVLVMGAFNVFEAAVASGVEKVVFASSASVYGGAKDFPTREVHHPYGNRTLYGAAKLMNEGIARSFHDMYGLPSVGLRYFNVYGPRMDVTGAYTEVFIRWLDCIEQGRAPQIHGAGSTSMDFVFVEDVARANLLAMKSDRVDDVYNVASGTETSLLALWDAMRRVSGASDLAPEHLPARKVNPVPRRLGDTHLAQRDLGFSTTISLEEGLRRLVTWRHSLRLPLEEVAR